MNKAKKKSIFVPIFLVILLIAALLDLKYKGLFYRLLPSSIQTYSDTIFGKPDASPQRDEM